MNWDSDCPAWDNAPSPWMPSYEGPQDCPERDGYPDLPNFDRLDSGHFEGFYNNGDMPILDRITRNPEIMAGKACIRGMRVTVATVVGLVASGHSNAEILSAYGYLEEEDIRQALTYAAWRVDDIEIPLPVA